MDPMTRLSKYDTYFAITLEYVKILMMICTSLFSHIVVASYNIRVYSALAFYSNALLLLSIVLYKMYGSKYSDTIRRNKTALLAWAAFIAGFGLNIYQITNILMFGYGLACSITVCGFYAGISDRYCYMRHDYDPYYTKLLIALSFVSSFCSMLMLNFSLRLDTMVLIRFSYYIMIIVVYVFWCVDKFFDNYKRDIITPDALIKKAITYPMIRLVQRVYGK